MHAHMLSSNRLSHTTAWASCFWRMDTCLPHAAAAPPNYTRFSSGRWWEGGGAATFFLFFSACQPPTVCHAWFSLARLHRGRHNTFSCLFLPFLHAFSSSTGRLVCFSYFSEVPAAAAAAPPLSLKCQSLHAVFAAIFEKSPPPMCRDFSQLFTPSPPRHAFVAAFHWRLPSGSPRHAFVIEPLIGPAAAEKLFAASHHTPPAATPSFLAGVFLLPFIEFSLFNIAEKRPADDGCCQRSTRWLPAVKVVLSRQMNIGKPLKLIKQADNIYQPDA